MSGTEYVTPEAPHMTASSPLMAGVSKGASQVAQSSFQTAPLQWLKHPVVRLKSINPGAGVAMESRWAAVIRGIRKPWELLATSKTAEG